MGSFKFYCDEAGNTGSNFIDDDQPILVIGGWIVPGTMVELASDLLKYVLSELKPSSGELHANQLLRRSYGGKLIAALTYDLSHKLGCIPICLIAEKRYVLATHIIDIFLAPESNPYLPDSFDFDFEARNKIADVLDTLPDDTLAEFAAAFKSLDRYQLIHSLSNIVAALRLRGKTALAKLMMASMKHIDIIVEENTAGRAFYPSGTMTTPNFSAFISLFSQVEHLGRLGGFEDVEFVFDESRQYNEAFKKIFKIHKDAEPYSIDFPNGNVMPFGFEALKEFRVAKSEDEVLLQASDLLVSSIYKYSLDLHTGKDSSPEIVEIARSLFTEDGEYPSIPKVVTSKKFCDKLFDLPASEASLST